MYCTLLTLTLQYLVWLLYSFGLHLSYTVQYCISHFIKIICSLPKLALNIDCIPNIYIMVLYCTLNLYLEFLYTYCTELFYNLPYIVALKLLYFTLIVNTLSNSFFRDRVIWVTLQQVLRDGEWYLHRAAFWTLGQYVRAKTTRAERDHMCVGGALELGFIGYGNIVRRNLKLKS